MIRRFLGGAAITTAATALLLSTLSGTANAAVGTVNVAQVFTSDSIPVCVQDYVAANPYERKTIHDPTCTGATLALITIATVNPITVHSGTVFVSASNGVYLIPIGPSGIDIDFPPGL
jgi:hypothetical protein